MRLAQHYDRVLAQLSRETLTALFVPFMRRDWPVRLLRAMRLPPQIEVGKAEAQSRS